MKQNKIEVGMKFVILETFSSYDNRALLASHDEKLLDETTILYERIVTDWNTVQKEYNFYHYDYFEKNGKTLPKMTEYNFQKLAKRFLSRKQYRTLGKAIYKIDEIFNSGKVIVELVDAEMKLTDGNGNIANL